MILKKLARLSILLFVIQGCSKNDSILLEGSSMDGKTGGIVSNAEILISSNSITNGFYNNNFIEVARGVSDNTGQFELEFKPGNAVEFEIVAIKSGMIKHVDTISRDEWVRGEENKYRIDMYRASQIEFDFNNSNSSNTILFTLDPKSDGCNSCCPSYAIAIKPGEDTSFVCQVYGNQTVSYDLNTIDGSSSSIESGTIQVYEDKVPFVYTN